MSCPICGIGANYKPSSRTSQRTSTVNKGPSRFSTYPPYAGPQDSITLANERPLDYPFIHAKIYNRQPSSRHLELRAEVERDRSLDDHGRPRRPAARGGNNAIKEAIGHLQTAERLLTH